MACLRVFTPNIDERNSTIPAHRLCNGNEEVVGLLVDGGVGLKKDAPIRAYPKGPVHMIGLQLQL